MRFWSWLVSWWQHRPAHRLAVCDQFTALKPLKPEDAQRMRTVRSDRRVQLQKPMTLPQWTAKYGGCR